MIRSLGKLGMAVVMFVVFAQCNDIQPEALSPNLFVGAWENLNGVNSIEMDNDHNFVVRFGEQIVDTLKYQPHDPDDQKISLYDINSTNEALVTYECEYQFTGSDQLALTIIKYPTLETRAKTALYRRLE